MPSWNALLAELDTKQSDDEASRWLNDTKLQTLRSIGELRGDRHVLLYGSAFLQKPQAPPQYLQITAEEMNGLMAVIHGMDWSKGLTLVLHTPGGVINAAESMVAYLRTKFTDIEVIVPAFAMSAGTMLSLAADRVVMGRQSQLGPIDPQMGIGGRSVSARAVVEQFDQGRKDILANVAAAHVWAPILQAVGPALLVEAQNALDYGEQMVAGWLSQYMFAGDPDSVARGKAVASHFNDAAKHKSHGRRIDRDEAASQGLSVEELEASQELQEQVLTAYHLMTIAFERSPMTKIMSTDTGRNWVKSWMSPEDVVAAQQTQGARQPPRPASQPQPSGPNRAQRRQGGGKGR